MSQVIVLVLVAGIFVTAVGIIGSGIYVVNTRGRARHGRGKSNGKG